MQNIFVGNLALTTSEQTLRAAFEAFGRVLTVKLVVDRNTGGARGIAFIEMSNDQEAEAAIAGLNGILIDGRPVTVNEARPKQIDPSSVHSQMRRHRQHRY